jgi:hypothetical protein
VIDAARPGFEQSLRAAQGALSAQASSPFNTAFGLASTDLSSRAVRDFNLFQAQQLAQGQERAISAANVIGSLASAQASPLVGLLGVGADFFNPAADPQQTFAESFLGQTLSKIIGAGASAAGGRLASAGGGGG